MGALGRCQSFVISQWQRSTGQAESGAFTEADVDEFVRNWQPILERFKQIGANVVQRNRDERLRRAQQAQAEVEASARAQAETLQQEQEAERVRQIKQREVDIAAEKLIAQDRSRVELALAKQRPRLKVECTDSARASAAAARSRDLSMWAHGDIPEYLIRYEKDLFDQDYRRCIHAATHQMAMDLLEADRR